MRKEHSAKLPVRVVAGVMLVLQIFVGMPLPLMAQMSEESPTPTPVPDSTPQEPVEFHSGQPDETIIHPQLQFSAQPSDDDITTGRVFQDPLIPTTLQSGVATDPAENGALAVALLDFKNRAVQDDWSTLTDFMSAHPYSRWNAALDLQVGLLDRQNGYFSKALDSLEDGWARSRNETDTQSKMMADRIVGELLDLYARCGRMDRIQAIFNEIEGRKVCGPGAVKVTQARESYWVMKNKPDSAFRCGPMAINSILDAASGVSSLNPLVSQEQVTADGTSLDQLRKLSAKVGLNYQSAHHASGSAWVVPSVVHWKVGHFGAIIGRDTDKDRYLVKDAIFQGEMWVSASALESESSGYALIPGGTLPIGWAAVSAWEAGAVWGKGDPTTGNEDEKTIFDSTAGGDGNGGGSSIAGFSIMKMLGTLQISITPVKYAPAYGPPISFSLVYNYLETRQPSNFTFMNTGIFWTNNWTSYVVVDSSNNLTVTCRGGGTETYNFSSYDKVRGQYAPNRSSQAVLKRVVTSDTINPIIYQRVLPDGSMEVYSQPDSTGRILLKKVQDPQGNAVTLTYDGHFRLKTITAADGALTNITYLSEATGNVGYYKVDTVTCPSGRIAKFTYDSATTTVLSKVSLIRGATSLGLDSEFTYGDNNFIEKLKTPYGETHFYPYIPVEDGTARGLMAILPNGSRQVLERYVGSKMMTYYWDRQAMDTAPGDRDNAYQTRWMMNTVGGMEMMEGVPKWTKAPLEGKVVYTYEGESTSTGVLYSTPDEIDDADTLSNTHFIVGKINKPSSVSRKLDDGNTQSSQFTYNAIGHVTKSVDPLGRTFSYLYPVNNIDLYEIRQTSGSNNALLMKTTYSSKHQPLKVTDASGSTTIFTYNPATAQLWTVTNAKGETTTYDYGTTVGIDKDRLTKVTGAFSVNDITTYGYDSSQRLSTSTSVQGPNAATDNYTVTSAYDDLDRVVSVTYPDGTKELNNYFKGIALQLDLQSQTDRLGRETKYLYDDHMGQLVQTCDPQGRKTTYTYLPSGLLATLTDPGSNATNWAYDEQGRVKRKSYSDGKGWDTTYENLTSRVSTVTDARGTVTTNTYNVDDSVASTSYTPGSGVDYSTPTVSYTYDVDYPRIHSVGDSWGTYTYNYNPYVNDFYGSPSNGRGKVSSVENSKVANSTQAFTYDELGRVTDKKFKGVSIEMITFDAAGRMGAETNPLGIFTPTYHNADYGVSRPDKVTCSNGMTWNFAWEDNTGDFRLREINNKNAATPSATISKFNYVTDAAGRIKQWTKQTDSDPAVPYNISYNRADEVTAVTTSSSGMSQYSYTYDAAGNRTGKQTDNNGTDTKVSQGAYNDLNQITSADGAGGPTRFQGSLDKPGTVKVNGQDARMWDDGKKFAVDVNLNTGSNPVTVAASSQNDAATQTKTYTVVVPSGGSRALTYDANGNMTADGDGRTFTWDAANQLVRITYTALDPSKGTYSKFTYDAMGQRAMIEEYASGARTSTKVFVGNEQRDGIEASSNVTRQYFDEGYRDVPGNHNFYYTDDHLGNIREVVADDGTTIVARYDYDPYGKFTEISGSQESDFLFTGYYYHGASGLYLSPTRAYDSKLGRFISRDPIAESGGLNLYAYCGNDPINGTDPMGLAERPNDPINFPGSSGTHWIGGIGVFGGSGSWLDSLSGLGVPGINSGGGGGGGGSHGGGSNDDNDDEGDGIKLENGLIIKAPPKPKRVTFHLPNDGMQEMTPEFASIATMFMGGGVQVGRAAAEEIGALMHVVYQGFDNAGVVRYVGRTERAPALRFGEHANSIGTGKEFLNYRVLDGATGLTRTEARVWEQNLINKFGLQGRGQLLNKINSIAPRKWQAAGVTP